MMPSTPAAYVAAVPDQSSRHIHPLPRVINNYDGGGNVTAEGHNRHYYYYYANSNQNTFSEDVDSSLRLRDKGMRKRKRNSREEDDYDDCADEEARSAERYVKYSNVEGGYYNGNNNNNNNNSNNNGSSSSIQIGKIKEEKP